MIKTIKYTALLTALALGPSLACAQKWGPTWSEVTGQLYSRTELNRTPAIIKSIDGRHSLDRVVRSDSARGRSWSSRPRARACKGRMSRWT
jgi:hypothetical protein